MEMYFRFCNACNCYEYDCFGTAYRADCIKGESDYKPAHQRARDRAEAREQATSCECGDKLQPCGQHVEVDPANPCEECAIAMALAFVPKGL
jgi:hypothetical protein